MRQISTLLNNQTHVLEQVISKLPDLFGACAVQTEVKDEKQYPF